MISTHLTGVNKTLTDLIHASTLELAEESDEPQLAIHADPRVAFQETFAHHDCTDYIEK